MSWPQLKAYCCPGNFCAEVKASLSEIQARPGKFARALAAELLGTMLLVRLINLWEKRIISLNKYFFKQVFFSNCRLSTPR